MRYSWPSYSTDTHYAMCRFYEHALSCKCSRTVRDFTASDPPFPTSDALFCSALRSLASSWSWVCRSSRRSDYSSIPKTAILNSAVRRFLLPSFDKAAIFCLFPHSMAKWAEWPNRWLEKFRAVFVHFSVFASFWAWLAKWLRCCLCCGRWSCSVAAFLGGLGASAAFGRLALGSVGSPR